MSRTDMYIFGCIIYRLSGGIVCVSGWPACLRDHTTGQEAPPVGGATYLLSSPDVDTAVYVDRLACDVVTVYYQVADGPGDLIRLPEAA